MKKFYIIILVLISFSISFNTLHAQAIWTGPDVSFTRAADVDWTLPENQDSITEHVIFTRQSSRQLYNYKWFQEMYSQDAPSDDLYFEFWDGTPSLGFLPSGGTRGVSWAILSDAGADSPWDVNFAMYGTLGDPTHFYSFHNIATMISQLNYGNNPVACPDSFDVEMESGTISGGTDMTALVGKDLACWIRDENIYFTLSFSDWGSGGTGSVAYTRASNNTVSINTLSSSLSVYPNPSKGIFTVNVDNDFNLEVLDITGRLINTKTVTGNTTLELNTAGVYLLKFSNAEGSITKKVIVQ